MKRSFLKVGLGLGFVGVVGIACSEAKSRDFGEDDEQGGQPEAGTQTNDTSSPSTTDDANPLETEPMETDPMETDPMETDPMETDPMETDPMETDPMETDPMETDPMETDPMETDPMETDPMGEVDASAMTDDTGGVDTTTPETDPSAVDGGSEPPSEAGPAPMGAAVTGEIIDFWGHPIPDVPVMIGEETTLTNDDGEFVFEQVPETYDVSFIVEYSGGPSGVYAWRYEGLTRRDPTLQVDIGLGPRYGTIIVTPTNAVPDDLTQLTVALGGPDGAGSYGVSSAAGLQTSTTWYGPQTTQSNVHALFWQHIDDLPTQYLGYDTALVALADATTTDIGVDLAEVSDITAGVIAGNVSGANGGDRENSMFLQFPDGAVIPLVDDSSGPDAFSYVAPALPEGSIVMAASEGSTAFSEGYGLAYQTGLTPGGGDVNLSIPSPASLLLPSGGADAVTSDTTFRWEGSASTYVLHIEDSDYYQGIYIVTSRKELTLSTFLDGAFVLRSAGAHTWTVETHGDFESVDELAEKNGFMDPFSHDFSSPRGPREGSGEFTVSSGRGFVAQ
jgi:pentapeptide MXKDX repeat protein